ncbi:MAG: hypothetical protein M9944_20515 [Rhizobiaceae bacterium]|nr:hypothetical protein [Rhizobiaceae bacterium]MCO5073586.1 hypothetical protein [Rhizobiaceae bacterium]
MEDMIQELKINESADALVRAIVAGNPIGAQRAIMTLAGYCAETREMISAESELLTELPELLGRQQEFVEGKVAVLREAALSASLTTSRLMH